MRILNQDETKTVSGAKTAILKLNYVEMDVLVTYSTRFVGKGTYGGYWLGLILYPNEVHDLGDNLLPYDVSDVFFHNGHMIIPIPVEGGHIYKIMLGEG
ncbi:MAG: hypothetical protein AB7I18_04445 [Candidatus Berkiella sp.]